MENIIIKPKDKDELNFFLELAKRLGSKFAIYEDDPDDRLFKKMELNKKSPKISKERVIETIQKKLKE